MGDDEEYVMQALQSREEKLKEHGKFARYSPRGSNDHAGDQAAGSGINRRGRVRRQAAAAGGLKWPRSRCADVRRR